MNKSQSSIFDFYLKNHMGLYDSQLDLFHLRPEEMAKASGDLKSAIKLETLVNLLGFSEIRDMRGYENSLHSAAFSQAIRNYLRETFSLGEENPFFDSFFRAYGISRYAQMNPSEPVPELEAESLKNATHQIAEDYEKFRDLYNSIPDAVFPHYDKAAETEKIRKQRVLADAEIIAHNMESAGLEIEAKKFIEDIKNSVNTFPSKLSDTLMDLYKGRYTQAYKDRKRGLVDFFLLEHLGYGFFGSMEKNISADSDILYRKNEEILTKHGIEDYWKHFLSTESGEAYKRLCKALLLNTEMPPALEKISYFW